MHLPNEIILQALEDLPSGDLKAARLVDRQWSLCAAKFLFDTLYISPHKPNIDAFQCITQHPELRTHVTKLVYDGVGFSTKWTYSEYFKNLWSELGVRLPAEFFDSPDFQINSFIESPRRNDNLSTEQRLRMAEEQCGDFDFIKAGYKAWQAHALYERKCRKNNKFRRILTMGLRGLDRLRDMELLDDGTWESVFEALKFRRLSSFNIKSSQCLCYGLNQRKNFLSRMDGYHAHWGFKKRFLGSLERYIVHGLHDLTLRHPNLQGKQATEDSLDYLGGIFDHAKGSRCIMDIDVAKLKERIVEACAEGNRKRQSDPKG